MNTLSDQDREALIKAYHVILTFEDRHRIQHQAFGRMRELINGRSVDQIRRMEETRGLRPEA